MKEVLYTIPVNDAFNQECECPVCEMKRTLEQETIAYTMGPSYMEDDVRMKTDEIGFCSHHMHMLYDFENRLGLGLILSTHLAKIINDVEKAQKKGKVSSYIQTLNDSCFVCNKMNPTFDRYVATIFHLYEHDDTFRKQFRKSKGFCLEHYELLYAQAQKNLPKKLCGDFISELNQCFLDNMKRVKEDVDWFVDKFDYRNADAPWKNSKDALPRAMTKTNGLLIHP